MPVELETKEKSDFIKIKTRLQTEEAEELAGIFPSSIKKAEDTYLDLTDVKSVSAAGLGILVMAARDDYLSQHLWVDQISPFMKKLLEDTRLIDLFHFK